MKKLFLSIALLLPTLVWGGNIFNTLDAAPTFSLSGAIPSGGNLIGKVGIDQTTPGTTNAVQANAGTNLNTSALALDATVSAQSAKLPASLGAKSGGASLSVVPNTDTAFPASQSGVWTVQPGNTANTTPWLSSINDGSSTANNISGDSGQNAQVVTGGRKEVSFTTTTAQAVASTDVSNYTWVSVHIVTQGTSSNVTFQVSNDNINWVSTGLLRNLDTSAPGVTSTASAAALYHGPISGRYFRLNVTGISAGTTAGVVEFFSNNRALVTTGVSAVQQNTWTVQPGNTANTTAWKVDGSAVTQPVSMGASATGAYSFNNLKANATTTVKSGAGTLHTISINTKGLTNTVTVYDNTAGSGTTIATIDTTLGQDTLTFDLAFATGLTVVIAGGTAADITITYK